MAGMSQEGAVPRDVAAAAEQVFHALVFGSLQDMAVGATEVHAFRETISCTSDVISGALGMGLVKPTNTSNPCAMPGVGGGCFCEQTFVDTPSHRLCEPAGGSRR